MILISVKKLSNNTKNWLRTPSLNLLLMLIDALNLKTFLETSIAYQLKEQPFIDLSESDKLKNTYPLDCRSFLFQSY
jgi:hypothetical protein